MKSTDINIEFATNQPFDYSIDPALVSSQKYDFITVAIQALLKATGFVFKATCANEEIHALSTENFFTHNLLAGNTPKENYITATSNSAYIKSTRGSTKWPIESCAPYKPGISMNYFKTDPGNKETAIMQYGITKGTCIRYIGKSITDYFSFCEWDRDLATGIGGSDVFNITNTSNVISYCGINPKSSVYKKNSIDATTENLQDFLYSRAEASEPGSFVLLKDGSWKKYDLLTDLTQNENYARTIDGYLKIKEVIQSWGIGHNYYNWIVNYKLYDYVPQKPEAEMNSYTESTDTYNPHNGRSAMLLSNEDIYVDVEIEIKNLEGTTSVTVEQTDADYPVPYTYDIEDFKTGKFVAYMNKRFPSTFKVTYINKNGSTTGDSFTIDLTRDTNQLRSPQKRVDISSNLITYDFTDSVSSLKYKINKWPNGTCLQAGDIPPRGNINISSLPQGIYTLIFISETKKVYDIKLSK